MKRAEKYLDKYRPGWKQRTDRKKSLWNLLQFLVSLPMLLIIWYILFSFMWQVHLIAFPEHTGQIAGFWPKGIGIKAFISSFLLAMPLFFPAMGLSFIVINLIFWFIPPAREAFKREAVGDKEMTFIGATTGLLVISIKYLLPVGIGLSLVGALTLSSLK